MVKLADNKNQDFKTFVTNIDGIEKRTMTGFSTTQNNVPVVPTEIGNKIFEKVKEVCPLYAQAQSFEGVGTLKIAVEHDEVSDAEMLAEGLSSTPADEAIDTVTLEPKRITASLVATNQLLENTNVGLENYFSNYLGRRIGSKLSNVILNGQADSETDMLGIYKFLGEGETTTATALADAVISQYSGLKQEYVQSAEWVMDRDMFNKLLHLKNAQGDYYLVQWNQAQGYNILGLPVIVTSHAAANTILLINPQSSLASYTTKQVSLETINNDSVRALSDTTLFVGCAHIVVAPVSAEPMSLLTVTEA